MSAQRSAYLDLNEPPNLERKSSGYLIVKKPSNITKKGYNVEIVLSGFKPGSATV